MDRICEARCQKKYVHNIISLLQVFHSTHTCKAKSSFLSLSLLLFYPLLIVVIINGGFPESKQVAPVQQTKL